MRKRTFSVVVALCLISLLASANPNTRPNVGCTDGFIRFNAISGGTQTLGAAGVVSHLELKLGSEHTEQHSGNFPDCFVFDDVLEHHFQFVCEDTQVEMNSYHSISSTGANTDIALGFGEKSTSSAMDNTNFIEPRVVQTIKLANDITQHIVRLFDFTLQKDFFYAILISSENGGSPSVTDRLGHFWEITEMRCRT